MPLGNLTSQFFANVYLNELDQFVKHMLKAKHYIHYADDFVIFHNSNTALQEYESRIGTFLCQRLLLELHPEKSRIILLERGTEFLGFKIFFYYKLIKPRNLRKFYRTFKILCQKYENRETDYDQVYDFMEGWIAYAKHTNTYKLRRKILANFEQRFSHDISSKEINRGLALLIRT